MKNQLSKFMLLTLTLFSFTACFESDAENAVEDIGENIEEVADDTADMAEDTADEVEDKMNQ